MLLIPIGFFVLNLYTDLLDPIIPFLKYLTTVVIIINTIVPFPFDNFLQCDYKKVPIITVIAGIVDNAGWIVISNFWFDNTSDSSDRNNTSVISDKKLGLIANCGGIFCHIVHCLFYVYWKWKNDKQIDYTQVTEI